MESFEERFFEADEKTNTLDLKLFKRERKGHGRRFKKREFVSYFNASIKHKVKIPLEYLDGALQHPDKFSDAFVKKIKKYRQKAYKEAS